MNKEDEKFLFRNFYSSKTLFWTILFSLSFLVFELIILSKSGMGLLFLPKHFGNGNYFRFLFVLFLTVFAFGLFISFIYVAFASTSKYKIIYFLIFSLLVLTEYGYYKVFGFFFRFHELEIAFYAVDWGIISNAIYSYFNYWALIPTVVFGILLFKTENIFKRGWIPLIILVFLFTTFFLGTTYFTKNTFYVHSFNHGIRALTGFPVIWYVGTYYKSARNVHYNTPREKIKYKSSETPQNNIIFIVDESLRADRMSLNGYEVKTTPTLEKLEETGYLRNWGKSVSGTTCSVTSNALLLTGLRDLPDLEYKVYKLPTIFQFAKAMNYKKYYFDGQVSTHWNGKISDISDYGKWITANDLKKNVEKDYDIDIEIARRVKEIINNSKGNFIWISKYGIHQSHVDSFPSDETDINRKYDEVVRYNSESFFKELSNDENFGKNAIYIYTADHGVRMDESRATTYHCSNTKIEATVPLFMMSSPETLQEVDTNFKASHSNIFATILDLMNFPEDERKYDYAISLLKARESDSKKRFYFAGDLHKKEESGKYLFDE